VLDRAGWQLSPQVPVPTGLHRHFLAPHSPELQPAECHRPLTNEALVNRNLRDVGELQEVQTPALSFYKDSRRSFMPTPRFIGGHGRREHHLIRRVCITRSELIVLRLI
jgi:hypothetical protein